LVFVTKYRRRVFDGYAINRLRMIFDRVCTDFEAQLIEMKGKVDHVHLLLEYPPKVAVSNLFISRHGLSSRLLRKERPDIGKCYWKDVLWSPFYFASRHHATVHRAAANIHQSPERLRRSGRGRVALLINHSYGSFAQPFPY
jgi:putative transposase